MDAQTLSGHTASHTAHNSSTVQVHTNMHIIFLDVQSFTSTLDIAVQRTCISGKSEVPQMTLAANPWSIVGLLCTSADIRLYPIRVNTRPTASFEWGIRRCGDPSRL